MKKLIVLAASRLFPWRSPMKITRRFAVASLLVIAVAVVLGAPAPASGGPTNLKTQVKLYPAAGSPFPNARGTVTLYLYQQGPYSMGFSVSVSKLAPNASYHMSGVMIQTDAHGSGGAMYWPYPNGLIWSQSFQVYDSSGTLVLTSNR